MMIHTKSAIIIIVTLLLGLVLGVLLSGVLLRHVVTSGPGPMLSEHFVNRFHRIIDPDESQKDTVDSILENYSERFVKMSREHFAEMGALMDSMHVDLAAVLTEEQMENLKGRMRHWPFPDDGPFGHGRRPPMEDHGRPMDGHGPE